MIRHGERRRGGTGRLNTGPVTSGAASTSFGPARTRRSARNGAITAPSECRTPKKVNSARVVSICGRCPPPAPAPTPAPAPAPAPARSGAWSQ